MSNKSIGTQFERLLADLLSRNGFWVHRFQDNRNGQPCDMIACRNGYTCLIDCKACQGDSFRLSRMEENQRNAMELFLRSGNPAAFFAIRLAGGQIFLAEYQWLKELEENGARQVYHSQLKGRELAAWMAERKGNWEACR